MDLQAILSTLHEVEEYLDQRADAEYGPDGVPHGNAAMNLLGPVTELVNHFEQQVQDRK